MFVEDYVQLLEMSVEGRKQYLEENQQVVQQLLENVGHESAELRDQLNYRLFLQLLTENAFNEASIHEIVERLSSIKGLVFNLGEKDSTSGLAEKSGDLLLPLIP